MNVQPFSFREFAELSGKAEQVFVANKRMREEESVAAPPPPPTFSEEELKNAEREAYKKGFLEGTKEGHAQAQSEQSDIEKALLARAEDFVQTITPLFESFSAMALQLRAEMPRVALAIAQKVAGESLAENAQNVIEDVALRCCEHMMGEPRLSITVHESLASTLENKLNHILAGQQAAPQISVIGNAQLAQADCRIEWAGGALERRTQALWQNIERVINDMSLCAVRDGQAELAALAEHLPLVPHAPHQEAQSQDETTTDNKE